VTPSGVSGSAGRRGKGWGWGRVCAAGGGERFHAPTHPRARTHPAHSRPFPTPRARVSPRGPLPPPPPCRRPRPPPSPPAPAPAPAPRTPTPPLSPRPPRPPPPPPPAIRPSPGRGPPRERGGPARGGGTEGRGGGGGARGRGGWRVGERGGAGGGGREGRETGKGEGGRGKGEGGRGREPLSQYDDEAFGYLQLYPALPGISSRPRSLPLACLHSAHIADTLLWVGLVRTLRPHLRGNAPLTARYRDWALLQFASGLTERDPRPPCRRERPSPEGGSGSVRPPPNQVVLPGPTAGDGLGGGWGWGWGWGIRGFPEPPGAGTNPNPLHPRRGGFGDSRSLPAPVLTLTPSTPGEGDSGIPGASRRRY
jgi:hypothetical protein